ncbi:hypothetical protein [Actinoplanes sp. NPDC051851]|uniref:hypothetical protein n=1 Tax=Actinoplanes sp. NPDC051851 TaxID=3154753 RepID=UPI00343B4531
MGWKPDYITTADLKLYLKVDDAVDDTQLATWCTAASRAIDKKCNRQFGQLAAAASRVYRRPAYYEPSSQLWMVEIDDVQDSTGLTVGGVAYASSGATLLPDNASADGVPWTRLGFATCPTAPLTVVAKWGWTTVPAQVVGAAKLQANRWNKRRNSPLGVAGSPDQTSQIRLLARLDPDVATILTGLSRRRKVG